MPMYIHKRDFPVVLQNWKFAGPDQYYFLYLLILVRQFDTASGEQTNWNLIQPDGDTSIFKSFFQLCKTPKKQWQKIKKILQLI